MGKAVFTPKHGEFLRKNAIAKDMVLGHMAMDIEIAIKTTAGTPVSNTKQSGNRSGGGHMKAEARHFKNRNNQFRVEVNKKYAAYQERGARADGSHRVRHYSTAGTSAGWFRRAIASVAKNGNNYVIEAKRALNL